MHGPDDARSHCIFCHRNETLNTRALPEVVPLGPQSLVANTRPSRNGHIPTVAIALTIGSRAYVQIFQRHCRDTLGVVVRKLGSNRIHDLQPQTPLIRSTSRNTMLPYSHIRFYLRVGKTWVELT